MGRGGGPVDRAAVGACPCRRAGEGALAGARVARDRGPARRAPVGGLAEAGAGGPLAARRRAQRIARRGAHRVGHRREGVAHGAGRGHDAGDPPAAHRLFADLVAVLDAGHGLAAHHLGAIVEHRPVLVVVRRLDVQRLAHPAALLIAVAVPRAHRRAQHHRPPGAVAHPHGVGVDLHAHVGLLERRHPHPLGERRHPLAGLIAHMLSHHDRDPHRRGLLVGQHVDDRMTRDHLTGHAALAIGRVAHQRPTPGRVAHIGRQRRVRGHAHAPAARHPHSMAADPRRTRHGRRGGLAPLAAAAARVVHIARRALRSRRGRPVGGPARVRRGGHRHQHPSDRHHRGRCQPQPGTHRGPKNAHDGNAAHRGGSDTLPAVPAKMPGFQRVVPPASANTNGTRPQRDPSRLFSRSASSASPGTDACASR